MRDVVAPVAVETDVPAQIVNFYRLDGYHPVNDERQDGNGLLVAPNDVAGLARAIHTVVNEKEVAAAMGQAGRKLALSQFTLSSHLEALDRTYSSAVGAFKTK